MQYPSSVSTCNPLVIFSFCPISLTFVVEFHQTSVTSVTLLEQWEIRVQFAPADKALGFEFGFVVQGEDCVGGQCTRARVCVCVYTVGEICTPAFVREPWGGVGGSF